MATMISPGVAVSVERETCRAESCVTGFPDGFAHEARRSDPNDTDASVSSPQSITTDRRIAAPRDLPSLPPWSLTKRP